MRFIYLDNCSTTPLDERILQAMIPFLTENFGNANSNHRQGIIANDAVRKARSEVAQLLNAENHEIVFTSGSTESINLALKGIVGTEWGKHKHIITSASEHNAVLDTCAFLEQIGYRITYLPVMSDGLIDLQSLKDALKSKTDLVSIMYVNNETGVIQDIKAIAQLTHEASALLMSDCTQAVGKIPVDVDDLDIDLLAMSGHKIYGPKGVGALYVRQHDGRIKLAPQLHGGGHEKSVRSGTLNVPGIVGLGTACMTAQADMEQNSRKINQLRNNLEKQLLKIEGAYLNGNSEKRLFSISNIRFKDVDSDALIAAFSDDQSDLSISVSNGSACTSASIEASHVLTAMGLTESEAFNSIRFSLGKYNTQPEIDLVIARTVEVVASLRSMVC